jgi:hypothetical protein
MLPVLMLFIAVLGIFFLPVSTVMLHGSPLNTAMQDVLRESSEKDADRDLSSTDITPFTNREFVLYVPPAYMVEMSNFGYLDDAYYWAGNDDNAISYSSGTRNNDMYYPIANCSTIMLSAYERDANVKVEWMNATVLQTTYDEYYGWRVESGAEVIWASDLPDYLGEPGLSLDTSWEYELEEFTYKEIPIITWEVAPGWHILSGSVRITSDVPISVMHHKLKPGAATDTPDEHWAVAWWNGIFSGYGKKLMVRVAGDMWISALESPTKVNVWDMSDRDDDASFELDRFEGWEYTRNPILQQEGFDDDIVLISADHPVSVVGGIQDKHGFSQVYGKDGKDYLFPTFGKVLVHAPEGAHIILKDNTGNQGSFEGDLGDNQWTLDDDYYGTIHGEDYLTTYRETSLGFESGIYPHPAGTEFTVPIRSRAYATVQNLGEANKVQIDFSELSLPLTVDLPPYSSMTMEISENSYEYMDLEGQYQRETDAFWSNKNHPFVYRIVVDNNKREEVYLTWDDLTKGTTLSVKAEKEVMVFVDYERDYQRYVTGIDLIPGLESPAPRGIPEGQPMLVAIGGMIVAIDVLFVMGGRNPLIDQLRKWRS